MSWVACSTIIAQEWRRTCGLTCLPCSVKHFSVRRFRVTAQNVCDSPSTERLTLGVYKQLRRSDRTADGQPSAECCGRRLPKRQHTLATALTMHAGTP